MKTLSNRKRKRLIKKAHRLVDRIEKNLKRMVEHIKSNKTSGTC